MLIVAAALSATASAGSGYAAIHMQDLTVYEGGRRTQQEERSGSHVVLVAEPAQRNRSRPALVFGLIIQSHGSGRRDRPRSECVDAYSARAELGRFDLDDAPVLLTVDADAFRQSDVPGTSAPSPVGLDGAAWPEIALMAGSIPDDVAVHDGNALGAKAATASETGTDPDPTAGKGEAESA